MHVSQWPCCQKWWNNILCENTRAQKTDLKWFAMAKTWSMCSYGPFVEPLEWLFHWLQHTKRHKNEHWHQRQGILCLTVHVVTVPLWGDQFPLWHTHRDVYTVCCKAFWIKSVPNVPWTWNWIIWFSHWGHYCAQCTFSLILGCAESSLLEIQWISAALSTSRGPSYSVECGNFVHPATVRSLDHICATVLQSLYMSQQIEVLAFYCSWQLRELALVVDHLQVLDVVSDVAGTPQREGVIWVCRYASSRPFQKHPICQAPLWRWRHISLASASSHNFHCLGNHAHFLKIDQFLNVVWISLVDESHVLEQQRHEGDIGRTEFGHSQSIGPVVAWGIHQPLISTVNSFCLAGYSLPGLVKPVHRTVAQTEHHSEEWIKILLLL